MSKNMTELKPCPFCGGEAELMDYEKHNIFPRWAVICKECYATPYEHMDVDTEAVAAERWNRREHERE